jgi:hypothetical protein
MISEAVAFLPVHGASKRSLRANVTAFAPMALPSLSPARNPACASGRDRTGDREGAGDEADRPRRRGPSPAHPARRGARSLPARRVRAQPADQRGAQQGGGLLRPRDPARLRVRQGREADAVAEYLRSARLEGFPADDIEQLRQAFAASGLQGYWRADWNSSSAPRKRRRRPSGSRHCPRGSAMRSRRRTGWNGHTTSAVWHCRSSACCRRTTGSGRIPGSPPFSSG